MSIEYEIGHLYFFVSYDDELLRVPSIVSVVFIGMNLEKEKDKTWYFQDAISYETYGIYTDITGPSNNVKEIEIHTFSASGVIYVKDLKGLSDELRRCIVQRGEG